jgi:predicted RNA binding protein YcfA (HicA-like mRNA interferase family)
VTKLPVVSGDECISALKRLGYRVDHINGSHAWLVCQNRQPIPVPKHKELGHGLLRKIINSADISIAEFIGLLKK